MRSANKKHHNVGDIEMMEGAIIVEAWDAKYGKTYLYEELGELQEKLLENPGVEVAGFIVNQGLEMKDEIVERANDVAMATCTDIKLFNYSDWVKYKLEDVDSSQYPTFAEKWMTCVVESFARKRTTMAPLDEPCEGWVSDLISIMENWAYIV